MHARTGWVCGCIAIWTAGCRTAPLEQPVVRAVEAVGAMTSSGTASRRWVFEARHGGCIDEPRLERIQRIAEELSGATWTGPDIHVGVLASEQSNAFVLPSGHVYVTAGMLDLVCTDDELAAVVAHELSHLDDLSAFDSLGLPMDEKLQVEAGADARAVGRLVNARYDPAALTLMIARLAEEQPEGWARYRCERLADQLGTRPPTVETGESPIGDPAQTDTPTPQATSRRVATATTGD